MILDSSDEKEAAIQYIKGAVEGIYQKGDSIQYSIIFNRSWQEKIMDDRFTWPSTGMYTTEMIRIREPMSKELLEEYLNMWDSVDHSDFRNQYVFAEIIMPEMQPYFEGEISLEECVETLQNKATLYMTE